MPSFYQAMDYSNTITRSPLSCINSEGNYTPNADARSVLNTPEHVQNLGTMNDASTTTITLTTLRVSNPLSPYNVQLHAPEEYIPISKNPSAHAQMEYIPYTPQKTITPCMELLEEEERKNYGNDESNNLFGTICQKSLSSTGKVAQKSMFRRRKGVPKKHNIRDTEGTDSAVCSSSNNRSTNNSINNSSDDSMTSPQTSPKQRKYDKDIYNGVGGSVKVGSDDDRCQSVSGDDEDANGVSLPDSSVPPQRAAALPSNTDGGVLMTSSPRSTTGGDSDCDSDGDSDFDLENAVRYKNKLEQTHTDDNLSDNDNSSDSETCSSECSDDEPAIVGYGERRCTRSRNVSDSPPLDIQNLLTGVVVDDRAPDDIDVSYTYNINNDLAYSKCTRKFKFPVYSRADPKAIMAIRKKFKKFVPIKDTTFVKTLISKYTDSNIFDCNHYPSRFPSENLDESMTAIKTLSKCLTDDTTNEKTIMVQRSALGAALSVYSANVEVVPTIFQTHTNHVKDIHVYNLQHGVIPTIYIREMEFMVRRFMDARKDQPYDLIEGELELLCLAYWKLETQDLNGYDETVVRTNKKKILVHIVRNITDLVESSVIQIETILMALRDLQHSVMHRDPDHITAVSLLLLKKHLSTFLALRPNIDVYELLGGFFLDMKLHHIQFPHTYNTLVNNREYIYRWMFTMSYPFNFGDKERRSAFFDTVRSPNDTYTKHTAVFSKMDVFRLLSRFFNRESEVPLKLCIKIDNLFMIPAYWFGQYLVKTGVYGRLDRFDHEMREDFFELHTKNYIDWYEAKLIPFVYSKRLTKSFKRAILLTANMLSRTPKTRFNIDKTTLKLLFTLGHNYLSYALGPALVRKGPALTPVQWSNLFLHELNRFEQFCVLENRSITSNAKKRLSWLTDGVEDDDFCLNDVSVFNHFDRMPVDDLETSNTEKVTSPWCNVSDSDDDNDDDDDDRHNVGEVRKELKGLLRDQHHRWKTTDESVSWVMKRLLKHPHNDLPEHFRPNKTLDFIRDVPESSTSDTNTVSGTATTTAKATVTVDNYKHPNHSRPGNNDDANVKTVVIVPSRKRKQDEFEPFTLKNNETDILIGGVRTFGVVSNGHLQKKSRCGLCCALCAKNNSKAQNIVVDQNMAVSCCFTCIKSLYYRIRDKVNTFETIRDIIKIKVNDRYKQPLLFDSNNEFLDPLFPEMKTLSDLYPNTFNKLSPDFGKKLQARTFFDKLCVRNQWCSGFGASARQRKRQKPNDKPQKSTDC